MTDLWVGPEEVAHEAVAVGLPAALDAADVLEGDAVLPAEAAVHHQHGAADAVGHRQPAEHLLQIGIGVWPKR